MPNPFYFERERQQHLVRMGKPSRPPFDAEQVRVNRSLYPHLFTA